MSSLLQEHRRIDRRSLELHRAIAAKLRAHPALIEIARDHLWRWSTSAVRAELYWEACAGILNRPSREIVALREEDSAHMDAMRQATPFAGVLESAERWAVSSPFERQRAGQR